MEPVRVFVSYNHEQDTRWFEQDYFGERPLIPWLEHNIQEPDVVFWYDRKGLTPGDMLWDRIEPQINDAHIAILLISRGFMNSEFIQQREYPRIEERARARELTVIPIITRDCPWRKLALLTEVLGAPETRKPLLDYTESEVEFLRAKEQILQEIEEQVRKVRAARQPSVEPSPDAPEDEPVVEDGPIVAAEAQPAQPNVADRSGTGAATQGQDVLAPTQPQPAAPPQPVGAIPSPAAQARGQETEPTAGREGPWNRPGKHVGDEVIGPDGGMYVWVPAGEFTMGSEDGLGDQKPVHEVRITRGFWLGKHEVTNAQYCAFRAAMGAAFQTWSEQRRDHPVSSVNWGDAKAYCDHYGMTLPTEAQWEYAARGPEGRKYPWGDDWDAGRCCHWGNQGPTGQAFPVGSFPSGASWCGALDMAGNVWEWCVDWYGAYSADTVTDPTGPAAGQHRVLRGGSWYPGGGDTECRSATRLRDDPSPRITISYGFRCVIVPAFECDAQPLPHVPSDVWPWLEPGTETGQEIIGPDGGMYVWVPAGEFMMGSEDGGGAEKPVHKVRITRGFWLGKHEVTNAQYRAFCEATGKAFPAGSNQRDDHPVVCVTWDDAAAYCAQYGLALPTEAQWEYAARGPDGRKYPWGNEWDAQKCCFGGNKGPGGQTFPVGSFPSGASWCGALDMAGSVLEWCWDRSGDDYYGKSPAADPPGPTTGEYRVLRGGSWWHRPDVCRSASRGRSYPDFPNRNFGFRPVVRPSRVLPYPSRATPSGPMRVQSVG